MKLQRCTDPFYEIHMKIYNILVLQLTVLVSLDMHFWYAAAVFVVRDRVRWTVRSGNQGFKNRFRYIRIQSLVHWTQG